MSREILEMGQFFISLLMGVGLMQYLKNHGYSLLDPATRTRTAVIVVVFVLLWSWLARYAIYLSTPTA